MGIPLKTLAGAAGAAAAGLALAPPALAGSGLPISYYSAKGPVDVGTAVVTRGTAGPAVTVEVQTTLSAGNTYDPGVSPNLQICASTVEFSAPEPGRANCTAQPGGQWFSFTESGTGATETVRLGPPYGPATTLYLQVHLNTLDPATGSDSKGDDKGDDSMAANTSWVNELDGLKYGSVTLAPPTTTLPAGSVGILGFAALAGGGLVLAQRRRRRPGRLEAGAL